ncbi:uncharacterized protein BO95DRAFT_165934 [Aspergillus brunneoviolaceus CBS 621.78]|uniref:Uncharacterized protein n=1 Tax=Aspergillus brunneoviolaceus CBS 621.78 TaxID=1450534 RepID=A0ACD1G6D2_9EURO|nr:hypothetical protein BO95DRAFT_165934 [Aspergillus brunneoviolaceus CBS 621.78]RAH44820.1 hypothetical protein BO95DRAFT_165934 [Aspergillus brunneoviolaceus CBS 621.78]
MLACLVWSVCLTRAQSISCLAKCNSLLVCSISRRLKIEAATNYSQTGCCYWTHRLAAKMRWILCGDCNPAFLCLEMKALCICDVYICSHSGELYHDQWMAYFKGEVLGKWSHENLPGNHIHIGQP